MKQFYSQEYRKFRRNSHAHFLKGTNTFSMVNLQNTIRLDSMGICLNVRDNMLRNLMK